MGSKGRESHNGKDGVMSIGWRNRNFVNIIYMFRCSLPDAVRVFQDETAAKTNAGEPRSDDARLTTVAGDFPVNAEG